MDAQLAGLRVEALLEGSPHRRRDARRMPVHAHHGAEGLKPERIAQARKQARASVVMDDGLRDGAPERNHAGREPRGHAAAVQREVGDTGTLHRRIVTRPTSWPVTAAAWYSAGRLRSAGSGRLL